LIDDSGFIDKPTRCFYFFSFFPGAVASVTGIANPVSLARHIMHDTPHSLLVGDGAVKFAKKIGFPVLNNPLELISEESRLQLEGIKDFDGAVLTGFNTKEPGSSTAINPGHDTVGAVAMDCSGRLACATSTGTYEYKHGLKMQIYETWRVPLPVPNS